MKNAPKGKADFLSTGYECLKTYLNLTTAECVIRFQKRIFAAYSEEFHLKKVTDKMGENEETTALIVRDFELTAPENPMTEAELLAYLADVIAYMIEKRMDYLLSLLYRLDVSEAKINQALTPGHPEDANIALARLVIDRQKKRIATKKAYREQHPSNWNWDLDD
jgi:hypothetical protein